MKNLNDLKYSDKVKNVENGEMLEAYIWIGEKYLAGESFMWFTTDFDRKDWEIVEQKENENGKNAFSHIRFS